MQIFRVLRRWTARFFRTETLILSNFQRNRALLEPAGQISGKSQYKMYGIALSCVDGFVYCKINSFYRNCDKLAPKLCIIPDIYLKTLSNVDLRKRFYGIFHIIWKCVPDGLPSFKMEEKPWKRLSRKILWSNSLLALNYNNFALQYQSRKQASPNEYHTHWQLQCENSKETAKISGKNQSIPTMNIPGEDVHYWWVVYSFLVSRVLIPGENVR